MAVKPPSNQVMPLDPDEELTTPEARPALRSPAALGSEPPSLHLPPDLDLGPELLSKSAGDDEEVTLVDPNRRRLVSPEGLPPPPELSDFE